MLQRCYFKNGCMIEISCFIIVTKIYISLYICVCMHSLNVNVTNRTSDSVQYLMYI